MLKNCRSKLTLTSGNRGSAFVITLWLLAIIGVVVSAFTMHAVVNQQMAEALNRVSAGSGLAQAGVEAWMAQLRADAIVEDLGVVKTEIMNYYPDPPIKINEVDPLAACGSSEHVEIYNAAPPGGPSVPVGNWLVREEAGAASDFSTIGAQTSLKPGEFLLTTGSGLTNSSGVVKLLNDDRQLVDQFEYVSEPSSGNSWQVLPDGWNGRKPAANKISSDTAWADRECTEGSTNGKGMWAKVGNGDHEGIRLTQYAESGDSIARLNFGSDVAGPASKDQWVDKFFIDSTSGTGTFVLTSGLLKSEIPNRYSEGSEPSAGWDSSPFDFSDTAMHLRVEVPKPVTGDTHWKEYSDSDIIAPRGTQIDESGNILNTVTGISANNGELGYIARIDTSIGVSGDIQRWGDSTQVSPDPGSWRPSDYTGSAGDYRFNQEGDSDGRLYVSEVYDTKSVIPAPSHPIVTKLYSAGGSFWIQIMNPTAGQTFTIDRIFSADGYYGGIDYSPSVSLGPGDHYSFCAEEACNTGTPDDIGNADDNTSQTGLGTVTDGIRVEFTHDAGGEPPTRTKTDFAYCRDDQSVSTCESDLSGDFDGDGNDEQLWNWKRYPGGGEPFFTRKTPGGEPEFNDSDPNNDQEFNHESGAGPFPGAGYDTATGTFDNSTEFVELMLFGHPTPDLPDKHEFVELANTSPDTKDLSGASMEDSVDSNGNSITSSEFQFALHPDDSKYGSGNLKLPPAPRFVGLVVPLSADTSALGITNDVNSGRVRLFTLEKPGGANQFFTGGLYNEEMEDITINQPGGGSRTTMSSGNDWGTGPVQPWISQEKVSLDGGEVEENWTSSGPFGTPGVVPGAGDSYWDPWGWKGEIFSGVSMSDTVYLPSGSSSPQDGDIGGFRIVKIEDEGGKQSLQAPPSLLALDTSDGARTFTNSEADEIINGDGSKNYAWLTPGDLVHIGGEGMTALTEKRHSYSVYRDTSVAKPIPININTASYESLMGIQIHSDPSSLDSKEDGFMTEDMAKRLIDQRSGQAVSSNNCVGNSSCDDHFPELSKVAYPPNSSGSGFSSTQEACDILKSMNDNFECGTFKKYTTIESTASTGGGVFSVWVKGFTLDKDGKILSELFLEAVVDRRPVVQGTGPLEIIYTRMN